MMMMMMMINCFCGMVDRRKAFSLISSRDHCQRSSPSRISDTPRAGFEPAQSLSSGLVEISCAVVITTTPRRHKFIDRFIELTLLEYAHLCSMWSSSKYNLKLFLYAAIIIQLNSGKRESLRFLKFLLQINVNEWYSLVSARVMKLLLPSNFQGTESLSETCLNEVTFTNIKYTKQTLRWKFT